MSDLTTFTLKPDSPCDTEILAPSGHLVYQVDTVSDGKSTATRVMTSKGIEVAALGWGTTFPDRVKYGDQRPISFEEWMKRMSSPFGHHVYIFSDDQGRQYRWKGFEKSHSLQLFAEDDKYKTPILTFERESSDTAARITLTARAMEIQDLAVISFLFLEKNKRGRPDGSRGRWMDGTNTAATVLAGVFTAAVRSGGDGM